jgi:hypothetical protein
MNLRAAQVRIYLNADLLGPGKLLAGLRNDVTYPGDPGAVRRRIEALIPEPGPFIWRVSRTAMTPIALN